MPLHFFDSVQQHPQVFESHRSIGGQVFLDRADRQSHRREVHLEQLSSAGRLQLLPKLEPTRAKRRISGKLPRTLHGS